MELLDGFCVTDLQLRLPSGLGDFLRRPIAPDLRIAGRGIESQDATLLELMQSFVNAMGRGHIVMPHIKSERVAVNLSLELRILTYGLQLRSKNEGAAYAAIVEWLDSEAVANKMKLSFLTIPKSKGKHADEALNSTFNFPAFERLKHDFRIRTATPLVWAEISTYIFEIVDLAVEDDHITA